MFDEDEVTAAAWRAEARAWAREELSPEELYEQDVAEEYRREAWADAQPDEAT